MIKLVSASVISEVEMLDEAQGQRYREFASAGMLNRRSLPRPWSRPAGEAQEERNDLGSCIGSPNPAVGQLTMNVEQFDIRRDHAGLDPDAPASRIERVGGMEVPDDDALEVRP